MKAMVLKRVAGLEETRSPLEWVEMPEPVLKKGEMLIRVFACGVCHTELDEIEGRTPPPRLPVVPGHQVVGIVEEGAQVNKFKPGDRVGVGWIYSACGRCKFCLTGEENLCPEFRATGRDADGGYAQFMKVSEGFAFPIPDRFTNSEAAPLLCAGAIGYRSLRLTGVKDGEKLGLTGFGASAHLILRMARYLYPNVQCFVFARSEQERSFALELGAVWAGDPAEDAPEKLGHIIDTTPAWTPVVEALKNLEPGGRLVINAIRKEDRDKGALRRLDYARHLWMEKEIKSVANVARRDIGEFLDLAGRIPLKPEFQEFDLKDANRALVELKERKIRGAKVLRIEAG